MISVTRPNPPAAWAIKAQAETEANIALYRGIRGKKRAKNSQGEKPAFKFEAYKDPELREALNQVYGYKCAYCESYFGATQPVAVEHYRPKAGVVGADKRSSFCYFWLASTWQNLLPSCTDCNSQRRHTMVPGAKKVVRGKGNLFPLADARSRAHAPGKEGGEKRLLLHPELDDPSKHLEFVTDRNSLGLIRAAPAGTRESAEGAASIAVYALDRPQLVQTRQSYAKRLLSHLRNTLSSKERFASNPKNATYKAEYDENLRDLGEFLVLGQPYIAMVKRLALVQLPDLKF